MIRPFFSLQQASIYCNSIQQSDLTLSSHFFLHSTFLYNCLVRRKLQTQQTGLCSNSRPPHYSHLSFTVWVALVSQSKHFASNTDSDLKELYFRSTIVTNLLYPLHQKILQNTSSSSSVDSDSNFSQEDLSILFQIPRQPPHHPSWAHHSTELSEQHSQSFARCKSSVSSQSLG